MKKTIKNYSFGSFSVLACVIIYVISFFLPFYMAENSSVISLGFSTYGIAAILAMVLPALIAIVILLMPIDVIKKYVACTFMSLWLTCGALASALLLKAKFRGFGISVGAILAICSGIAVLFASIIANIRADASLKHKEQIWYGGINKIILLVNLPLLSCTTVLMVIFYKLLFGFDFLVTAAVFAYWFSKLFCSLASFAALYSKRKFGMLYYPVALLSVFVIFVLTYSAGASALPIGLICSAVSAAFWYTLGTIAKNF